MDTKKPVKNQTKMVLKPEYSKATRLGNDF